MLADAVEHSGAASANILSRSTLLCQGLVSGDRIVLCVLTIERCAEVQKRHNTTVVASGSNDTLDMVITASSHNGEV